MQNGKAGGQGHQVHLPWRKKSRLCLASLSSQSWSYGSEPGADPLQHRSSLRRSLTSAEAPAPPGPSPGHLDLTTKSPHSQTQPSGPLWLPAHHLLQDTPAQSSPHCRADSGCGLCGGQELRPCSPALAPENSVASGAAKLCHASISQGACKRLVPVAQPSPAEAELLGENRSREALGLFSLFKTSAHGV